MSDTKDIADIDLESLGISWADHLIDLGLWLKGKDQAWRVPTIFEISLVVATSPINISMAWLVWMTICKRRLLSAVSLELLYFWNNFIQNWIRMHNNALQNCDLLFNIISFVNWSLWKILWLLAWYGFICKDFIFTLGLVALRWNIAWYFIITHASL